jgi:hypothetical protein
MARTISLNLTLLFNQTVIDPVGNWQYAAATATDPVTQQPVQLLASKRETSFNGATFPASTLTATIMFAATPGAVPENITLQGVLYLKTNDESGSVSAASAGFADQIGGTFTFTASTGLLTISPPSVTGVQPSPEVPVSERLQM